MPELPFEAIDDVLIGIKIIRATRDKKEALDELTETHNFNFDDVSLADEIAAIREWRKYLVESGRYRSFVTKYGEKQTIQFLLKLKRRMYARCIG